MKLTDKALGAIALMRGPWGDFTQTSQLAAQMLAEREAYRKLQEKSKRQRRELRRLNKQLRLLWDGARFIARAEIKEGR